MAEKPMKLNAKQRMAIEAVRKIFRNEDVKQIIVCGNGRAKAQLVGGSVVEICGSWPFASIDDFSAVAGNWLIDLITDTMYAIKPKTGKLPGLPIGVLPAHIDELNRGLVVIGGPSMSGKTNTAMSLLEALMTLRNLTAVCYGNDFDCASINQSHEGSLAVEVEIKYDESAGDDMRFAGIIQRGIFDAYLIDLGCYSDEIPDEYLLLAQSRLVILTVTSGCNMVSIIDDLVGDDERRRVLLARVLKAVVVQDILPPVIGHLPVMATGSLWATSAIKNLIRESKSYRVTSAIQTGHKFGMNLFDECLAMLVKQGLVTQEVALERAEQPEELANTISLNTFADRKK
jgi:twitching motility protein PilT